MRFELRVAEDRSHYEARAVALRGGVQSSQLVEVLKEQPSERPRLGDQPICGDDGLGVGVVGGREDPQRSVAWAGNSFDKVFELI